MSFKCRYSASHSTVVAHGGGFLNTPQQQYFFDVGDHVIEVFMSSCSGKELVRIDDVEVSSRRNWRYRSSHDFELDGQQYRVAIVIVCLLPAW